MERGNQEFVRDRLKVKVKSELNWIFTLPSTLTRIQRVIIITCIKLQSVAKYAEQTRLQSRLAQLNRYREDLINHCYKKFRRRRQCPSPEKLEKLPCNARQQRRDSKVSFRIYNGESYRQDTNGSCRFEDEMEVRSSDNETDVFVVRTSHEKADAGLILHWHHIRCRTAAMLAKYLQNMQISCYS